MSYSSVWQRFIYLFMKLLLDYEIYYYLIGGRKPKMIIKLRI